MALSDSEIAYGLSVRAPRMAGDRKDNGRSGKPHWHRGIPCHMRINLP